jgi:hypothetical protein
MDITPTQRFLAIGTGCRRVVTHTGRTGRKRTALAAVALTEAVAGVTGVVDRLAFDTDDTVPPPAPRPRASQPMHGWWVGRRHNKHASGVAAPPWTPAGAHRPKLATVEIVP